MTEHTPEEGFGKGTPDDDLQRELDSLQSDGGRLESDLEKEISDMAHQPASASDLERFPPGTEACTKVRAALRDYVDDDLHGPEARNIEDHVHGCRACGLALARAELEVLRLRRAFVEERAEAKRVSVDLADRVRARVAAERQGPSADFTRSVMARVTSEYRAPAVQGQRRRYVAGSMLAAAAVLVAALTFWWSRGPELMPECRVVAVAGGAEFIDPVGNRAAVADGSVVPFGSRIETEEDAHLEVEWQNPHGFAMGSGPSHGTPHRLEVDGQSAFSIEKGALAVETGTFYLRNTRPLQLVGLADGQANLAAGRYDFRVAERRRFDGALTGDALLAVRLEVIEGAAEVRRLGVSREISAGHVAQFGHWQALEIEGGMTAALLARANGGVAVPRVGGENPEAPSVPQWSGRVIDNTTGRGVADALVRFDLGDERISTTTNFDGSYRIPVLSAEACVVEVEAPTGSALRGIARRPLSLRRAARTGDGGQIEVMSLLSRAALTGVVLDAEQQPLAAARIVPLVIDELFGLCDLREDLLVTADAAGQFELADLPVVDPAKQLVVALLVEHAGQPAAVFPCGAVDSTQVLSLEMAAGRDLRLSGLPPSSKVEVYQEVAGVDRSTFALRRTVETDSRGEGSLSVAGDGALWMVDHNSDVAVPFVALSADAAAAGAGVAQLYELSVVDADSKLPATLFGADDFGGLSLLSGAAASDDGWRGRSGARFDRYTQPAPSPTSHLLVLGADAVVMPGALLFVESAGSMRFLGEYTGVENFPFTAPESAYTIVAMGPDGSVGWSRHSEVGSDDRGPLGEFASIRLARTGSVEFATAPEGEDVETAGSQASAATLRFRMTAGPRAGHEFWRSVGTGSTPRVDSLIPGSYRVTANADGADAVDVVVESDGTAKLDVTIVGAPR